MQNRKHRVTDTRHGSGSLQPGRPPTNTLFNMPDTQRDRSNTVRVVQIIHRKLRPILECPKRCRAQELTAAIVSPYINVSHGSVVGYLPIFDTVCQQQNFLNRSIFGKIWIQVWWYCSIFDKFNIYLNASIISCLS